MEDGIDMNEVTTVDGISHFLKLISPSLPKNLVPVDESFLDKINYYRDGFCEYSLIKEKWNGEIVAYQRNSDGQLFIEDS